MKGWQYLCVILTALVLLFSSTCVFMSEQVLQQMCSEPLPVKSGSQTQIFNVDDDDDYAVLEQPAPETPPKAFFDSAGNCGAIVNGKRIYWVKDTNGNIVGVSETPPVKVQPKPKENLLQETGRKFR